MRRGAQRDSAPRHRVPVGIHQARRDRSVHLRRALWRGSGSESVLAGRALEQRHRAAQRRPAAIFRRARRQPRWRRRRKGTGDVHRSREPGRADFRRRAAVRREWQRDSLSAPQARAAGGADRRRAEIPRIHRPARGARIFCRGFSSSSRRRASQPRKISGLYSIDEKKLRALDAATLAELHAAGYLHAMYAMLSSLGHLQILARRGALPPASANG